MFFVEISSTLHVATRLKKLRAPPLVLRAWNAQLVGMLAYVANYGRDFEQKLKPYKYIL